MFCFLVTSIKGTEIQWRQFSLFHPSFPGYFLINLLSQYLAALNRVMLPPCIWTQYPPPYFATWTILDVAMGDGLLWWKLMEIRWVINSVIWGNKKYKKRNNEGRAISSKFRGNSKNSKQGTILELAWWTGEIYRNVGIAQFSRVQRSNSWWIQHLPL